MKNSLKIAFILHGKLKQVDKIKKRITAVFNKGFDVSFRSTNLDNGAKNETKEAIEANADFVIIAGGDGSINEMVNGYMATSEKLRNHVVLGVLPMGTGNDFARSIKVRNDLNELRAMIEDQSFINVDIGLVKFENLSGKTDQRYFINIIDIGIGGNVVEDLAKGRKFSNPNLTYTKAIVSSFLKYKKRHVELKSKSYTWSGKILSLCMANGKYFGSGICIAPDACVNDGKIELTIMGNLSLWDYIRNLSKIRKGEKLVHDEITYTTIEACSIQAPISCPIDMDGEFIGHTPLEMKVLNNSVRVIGRQ